MSEWLKEHAWKACVGETLPWVRIPLSPPVLTHRCANIRKFSVLRHRTDGGENRECVSRTSPQSRTHFPAGASLGRVTRVEAKVFRPTRCRQAKASSLVPTPLRRGHEAWDWFATACAEATVFTLARECPCPQIVDPTAAKAVFWSWRRNRAASASRNAPAVVGARQLSDARSPQHAQTAVFVGKNEERKQQTRTVPSLSRRHSLSIDSRCDRRLVLPVPTAHVKGLRPTDGQDGRRTDNSRCWISRAVSECRSWCGAAAAAVRS